MKKIFLIRHAKSDHPPGVDDFDRPLNKRGIENASMMAIRLKNRNIPIDGFVSSPANRAISTAYIFADNLSFSRENILLKPELYLPEVLQFYKVIVDLPDAITSIALFSHNNGITEFANALGVARIDHMPTSSIFACASSIKSWKEFRLAEKEFLFFDQPGKI